MALYTIDKNGGEAALVKQSLSAPDIKWETTQTVDVAVEGRLFNRLNFQIAISTNVPKTCCLRYAYRFLPVLILGSMILPR